MELHPAKVVVFMADSHDLSGLIDGRDPKLVMGECGMVYDPRMIPTDVQGAGKPLKKWFSRVCDGYRC